MVCERPQADPELERPPLTSLSFVPRLLVWDLFETPQGWALKLRLTFPGRRAWRTGVGGGEALSELTLVTNPRAGDEGAWKISLQVSR